MKIYIYDWELRETSPHVKIMAHALTVTGSYIRVIVSDFEPFCYMSLGKYRDLKYYTRTEDLSMRSSTNINMEEAFSKVYYKDYDMMKMECGKIAHMIDIDVVTLYLSHMNFPYTGWFEIKQGSISRHLKDDLHPVVPKIMYFDIECISSVGYGMPKAYRRDDTISLMSVVFKDYMSGSIKTYLLYVGDISEVPSTDRYTCINFPDEISLLEKFREIVVTEDPTVITGYNIFRFDLKYILDRCKLRLIPFPEICRKSEDVTTVRQISWTSNGYGDNHYTIVESSGRVFIDMILLFERQKLESVSLDYVSKIYLGEGKETGVSHEEIWRDRTKFIQYSEYCIKDSLLVLRLFEHFNIWDDLCERASIMSCRIGDIFTRGEQMKILNLFVRACMKRNIVPRHISEMKWNKLQGAYVMDPIPGVYNGCTILDFQSMYPSIIIEYNICPSTYIGGDRFSKNIMGIIPGIAKELLASRRDVKRQMKESDCNKRMILNFRQLALKICANSLYGALGFQNNKYIGHHP